MPQPFRGDLNTVQRASNVVAEKQSLAIGSLLSRPLYRLHQFSVLHDC